MIAEIEAKKIMEVLDQEIAEVKRIMNNEYGMRNVCIRRLQNCKNQVFMNSELYYIATGRRNII